MAELTEEQQALIAEIIAEYQERHPNLYTAEPGNARTRYTAESAISCISQEGILTKELDLPRLLDVLVKKLLAGRRFYDDSYGFGKDPRADARAAQQCSACGKEITRKHLLYRVGNRIFCGRCIHHIDEARTGRRLIETLCLECGRPFRALLGKRGRAPVYCSPRCSNTARKRTARRRKGSEDEAL